mgnify:CR=1 FL=1
MPKIDAKSNKNNFCCWKNALFREKTLKTASLIFHARGGPSNPQIRDKRAPEIIFNPLITILAPKLIEIQYILENRLIVDILRGKTVNPNIPPKYSIFFVDSAVSHLFGELLILILKNIILNNARIFLLYGSSSVEKKQN